ncbi:MAG: 2-oxoacid:acceptor oxidoreductase family protein [Archaeoglobaceae archaeon]|nr:2-oxoacid:acceptor oxidoreductase family protein [Archaeoglobaceae archaeon]
MLEITIYSISGQGGVTAAKLLALSALYDGKYSQAIPQFGPERRGALVTSYVRISDEVIRKHSRIRNPDIIVIFDVKNKVEVNSKIAILNSKNNITLNAEKIYCIDANKIASDLGLIKEGLPIINTAMVGATAKICNISLNSVKKAIADEIKDERNVKAAKIAYEVVKCD